MPRGHNEYFDRGTQMNLIFMITREEHKPALSDMMTDMFPLLLV
ncbi:heal labile enterotoxin subunit LT-A [Escherichia coli]|nr:heal labile enterotoxin subunit LT-A [Escherichia coli]